MKVIVASQNPVKIDAAKKSFEKMFPKVEFTFEGVNVSSGIPDQPIGEEQTITGAMNRVNNAFKLNEEADFFVSFEGGVEEKEGSFWAFAWAAVLSNGKYGKAKSSEFLLPEKVSELIKQGYELGTADDMVFKRENSKQSNGSIGLLTHDVITRTDYYEQAMILALIPFVNPELY